MYNIVRVVKYSTFFILDLNLYAFRGNFFADKIFWGLFLSARGPSLNVRIWRLWTLDSDV